nr:AraC family transcriptional regulator [uncultured Clostridium sp.]
MKDLIPNLYMNTDVFFDVFSEDEDHLLYHLTDFFQFEYVFLKIRTTGTFILIGPFKTEYYSEQQIEKLLYQNRIYMPNANNLKSALSLVPICPLNKTLDSVIMLNELSGLNISLNYLHYNWNDVAGTEHEGIVIKDKETDLAQSKLVEERYLLENIIMIEVASGNIEESLKVFKKYAEALNAVRRNPHPVKNLRAVFKLVNTVLRKGAENARVHPFYLDMLSANFTFYLDQANTVEACSNVGTDMIIHYCKLVQKHSLSGYSPHVRKALNYIHMHLYEKIGLQKIAANAELSPDYLTVIFKKETGKTITEYIKLKRIQNGCELLRKTDLSLQDISFYLGYEDYCYFGKIFKQITGVTPTQYRHERLQAES